MAHLDERGREVLDQTPTAIPLKHLRQRNRDDDIRAMIREELSRQSAESGQESFEEADDFDVGDDYDPTSPYEDLFDPDMGTLPRRDFHEEVPVKPTEAAPSGEPGKDASEPPTSQ